MLASELLTEIKRKGQIQSAQTVISDTDLIAMANRELQQVIAPKIVSLRDNYFSCQKDYSLSGRRRYRLPPRILGDRIDLIKILDGSGAEYNLIQTTRNERSYLRQGFYVTEGDIVLTGDLPTGTMRVFYSCRPALMVVGATTTAISSVSSGSFAVTIANGTYDAIRANQPYRTISPNISVTGNVGTNSDSSDYELFQAGDFVIAQDQSPYVPLEETMCDWLSQRTVMRYHEYLGHVEEMQLAGAKLADIERDIMALLSPRVSDQPKVVQGMESLGWLE